MMVLRNLLLTIFIGTVLISCSASRSTSIIYADDYDVRNDITSITILPYGGVKVPGKWTKTRENDVSGQHFFTGPDNLTFAVALNRWDNYEFFHNQITPETFVKEFYEWDANYLKAQTGGQIRIIKEDNSKNYIIWSLTNRQNLSEYFLFGLRGRVAYNLLLSSYEWDEARKIELLEKIYTQ
jgi:hypothetical protein